MPDTREMTLKAAIIDAITLEMRRDPTVFVFGEDVGEAGGIFKQTEGLFTEFGAERVIDTPISEPGMMGLVVGAAMAGTRPILEVMFGDFIPLISDQLVNQAAKIRYMSAGGFSAPMVVRTAIGVGGCLGPQHSQTLHAWCAHVPGLKVVMPATPADAKGLMASAIRDEDPVVFIEDRMTYNKKGQVPVGEHFVPIGKAAVLRDGFDVSLVAISRMVYPALEAAEILAREGIRAEVIDVRTLWPLDIDTLVKSVRKTSRAVVLDSGHRQYGAAGEIAATLSEQAFEYLDAPVLRIAAPNVPVPLNKMLEALTVPTTSDVIDAVRSMFSVVRA